VSFEAIARHLNSAKRSADAIVRDANNQWSDAQYRTFVTQHYGELSAESARFVSTLEEQARHLNALRRALDASR
jgi:hypothetical protein